MKKILLLGTLFCTAFCAEAYQTGPANRANFGDSTQQPAQSVPQNGYRSFSNYNNRNWGQGVQTQTVETSLAGSSAKEFEAPAKKAPAGKQAAQPAQAAKPMAKPAQAQPSTPAASAPTGDPVAILQQVQGMMQNMQSMTGGTPATGQPAAGQASSASTGTPAGMPDISALMGGMMPAAPSAAPATPAKK